MVKWIWVNKLYGLWRVQLERKKLQGSGLGGGGAGVKAEVSN